MLAISRKNARSVLCFFRAPSLILCGVYSVRYSNFYAAFELIDDAAARAASTSTEISAGAWFACEDICKRNGLNYGLVRTDILKLRASVARMCDNEITFAKRNLLKWYHDGKASEWPHLEAYARVVFVMAWETVLAEERYSATSRSTRAVIAVYSVMSQWTPSGNCTAPPLPSIEEHARLRFPGLTPNAFSNMLSPSTCVQTSRPCVVSVSQCAAVCCVPCAVCRVYVCCRVLIIKSL